MNVGKRPDQASRPVMDLCAWMYATTGYQNYATEDELSYARRGQDKDTRAAPASCAEPARARLFRAFQDEDEERRACNTTSGLPAP